MKWFKAYFFLVIFIVIGLSQKAMAQDDWKAQYDTARSNFLKSNIEESIKWLEDFIPKYKEHPDYDVTTYYEMIHLLGRSYLKKGYAVNAEDQFKQDVEFFKQNQDLIAKSTYASSMIYLGYMYYGLKKYEESERYFLEVMEVKSKLKQLTKAQKAFLVTNMATLCNMQKKYARADSLYRVCLALKKDVFTQNSDTYAKTHQEYATLMRKMGRYSEAEPTYKQTLEIRKKVNGEMSKEYISVMENLGYLYELQGRYLEADEVYRKTAQLTKDTYGENTPEYCKALRKQANLYRLQRKYNLAEPILLQVLQIVETTSGSNNLEYTSSLLSVASLYRDMNQFKQSELFYQSALSIYEVIVGEYHESYLAALIELASLYRIEGRIDDAEPLFLKAVSICDKVLGKDNVTYADLISNYGIYLQEIGHYEQSELIFKEALDVTEAKIGRNNSRYATTLDNLADLYTSTGHYEQAEPIFLEAMKIRETLFGKKHPEYATSLNNTGNLYESMGRYDDAERLYLEARDIIKTVFGTQTPNYANLLDNLAAVYESKGEYQEAEKSLKESMEILKKIFGERHIYYTSALNNYAILQKKLGNNSSAEKLLKENLEKTKALLGEKNKEYAVALSNLASLYEVMGRYDEAERMYEQALTIKKEVLGPYNRTYIITVSSLAGLYTFRNEFDKADKLWEEVIELDLEQIRRNFPTLSEKEKGAFYREVIQTEFDPFNSYAILRASSRPEIISRMYNNQLETKAMLLHATNKVRQRILTSGNEKLIEKYKSWTQQKELIAKLYSYSKEELTREKINLDSIQLLADRLEKEIAFADTSFRQTTQTVAVPYTWKDVRKKLKEGEAAIEIIRFVKHQFDQSGFYTDSIFYAALIVKSTTENYPEFVLMKNGNDLEKKYINYYKNVIKYKIADNFSYVNYWKQIQTKLDGINRVYLSPDGVYNQININTLLNNETGKYLIDELDIQIVTNTKDLLTRRPNSNTKKGIFLVGDPDYTYEENTGTHEVQEEGGTDPYAQYLSPLPGTRIEIDSIGSYLQSKNWVRKVSLGIAANEKEIKNTASPRILHIATHGFFEKNVEDATGRTDRAGQNPLLRSGLMLAGASVTMHHRKNAVFQADKIDEKHEDNILTAYEVMSLNLDNTDLVVLSACETGLGDVSNGEGVYGLQRAFIIAGANSIILSLWKVNDETTQKLMTTFYREYQKNTSNRNQVSKREAFRKAQAIIKEQFPDPYYWGAFIVIGE